MTEDKF